MTTNEYGHIIGPVVDPSVPLAVLDITEGVVQGEYLYEGRGRPVVLTLDFDRDEAPLDELLHFRWAVVESACVAIEGRSDHPDDLVQVAEWRRQADEMIEDATISCPSCGEAAPAVGQCPSCGHVEGGKWTEEG